MKRIHTIVFIIMLLSVFFDSASERDIEQVKRGNFLLPTSQQPSRLFSLGQNIVDKGDIMAFSAINPLVGPDMHSFFVTPYLLYGITDRCAVVASVPFSFFKNNESSTHGLADMSLQLEYAFYEYNQPEFTHQATLIGALILPTGSTKKTPALGAGATSFLLGSSVSYYSPEWLYFACAGGTLTTKGRALRAGSSFLYQVGLGKNIATRPGWIFSWIVELAGNYTTRDRWCSVTQRNSGGNVLYLTPSLWISSEHLIVQAGITFIPAQHLFGCQNRNEIGGLISLGWKFNS